MLGGLLSLASAVTFAYANASVRRGVLTGTVLQAVAISLPVALPFFVLAMLMTGGFQSLARFSWRSLGLLALAGVIHFAWARHCNYRATKAMGANLVAPIQQYSLVITFRPNGLSFLELRSASHKCFAIWRLLSLQCRS